AWRRYRATRKAPMNAAHSAARVPIRIHTALSEKIITIVAMIASISSTASAMPATPRSSPRADGEERGLSVAPAELMLRMIRRGTAATRVTCRVPAERVSRSAGRMRSGGLGEPFGLVLGGRGRARRLEEQPRGHQQDP